MLDMSWQPFPLFVSHMRTRWSETEKTILCVTHYVEEAVTLADRAVVLSKSSDQAGEIVDVGLERPRSRTDAAFAEYHEHILSLIRKQRRGDTP